MPKIRVSATTHALCFQCKGLLELKDMHGVTLDTVVYESVQSYLRYLNAGR